MGRRRGVIQPDGAASAGPRLMASATSSYATDKTGSKSSCGSGARARRRGGLEASPRLSRILVIAGCSLRMAMNRSLTPRREVSCRRKRGRHVRGLGQRRRLRLARACLRVLGVLGFGHDVLAPSRRAR
jgi:hypothetical protein